MNESQLEMSVMELFGQEGYEYIKGEGLFRESSDVLLQDDLKAYLLSRYSADGMTETEAESIILSLVRSSHDPLYDANREMLHKITEGFIFRREDKTKKDLFIRLIDFETPKNNLFKVVNQFEVQGMECLRIPDAVVFINGLPLVVIEFKSATRENATIFNAYEQLTVRYTRDIPDLFKYNAFVVISDGVNNKYGSLFADYDYFYAWRKIEDDETEVDGINSLYSMVKGLFRKDRLLSVIKDFIFFPDQSQNELKVVCRYPQFFAATKLLENIKLHIFDDYHNGVIEEKTVEKVLQFILSYLLRRLVCGIPSNTLRGLFIYLYNRIFKVASNKQKYYETINKFLFTVSSKDAILSEAEFERALQNANIYGNPALCRFLLLILKMAMGKRFCKRII